MSKWQLTKASTAALFTALFVAGAAYPPPSPATPPPDRFADAARGIVQGYTDRNQFSGYVLVAHEGKPVFSQGFGFADREERAPPTSVTRFRIGSITKQFTAAAVLPLVEEGKVGLDDPVRKYYPRAPATWDSITVRHLLEHRSGLFNLTNLPTFGALLKQRPTPEQLINVVRDVPLDSEPGTKFAYGNTGPVLLGYIIERVSGMSYRDFIQRRIFDRLGMSDSGYEFMDPALTNRAVGYDVRDGHWAKAHLFPTDVMYAAGAIYSSADDLLRWDQALYNDLLLTQASRAAMLEDVQGDGHGYGWFIEDFAGRPSQYAGGGQPGFLSFLHRFPRDHVIVIVLANMQAAPIQAIAHDLSRLYFGVPAPAAPTPVQVTESVLDRYVGTYELFPGARLAISRVGRELFLRRIGGMPPPPAQPEPLVPIAVDTFVGQDCLIVFPTQESNPAQSLSYTIPRLKTERPARRVAD